MHTDNNKNNTSLETPSEREVAGMFKSPTMFWRIKRNFKFWWQRRTRGWDDSDLWSLDVTIAQFILPRLKHFRNNHMGYPSKLQSNEAWNEVLDKMIKSFELVANEKIILANKKDMEIFQEGFNLFSEYYLNLWD